MAKHCKLQKTNTQLCFVCRGLGSQTVSFAIRGEYDCLPLWPDPCRCKIVDFGLSDYVSGKERTVTDAGTEAYLAPEVGAWSHPTPLGVEDDEEGTPPRPLAFC